MALIPISEPVLHHDGSPKSDEMRLALIEAGQPYQETPTGTPNTAVVIHDGNCYYSPQTVREQLLVRLKGYRR